MSTLCLHQLLWGADMVVRQDTSPSFAAGREGGIRSYRQFLYTLLSEREAFFEEVVDGIDLAAKLRYGALTVTALAGFFGLVAGAYSGPAQAVSAGIKLPFLFFATLVVCVPAFFVVQVLVGSRLRLRQVVGLLGGGPAPDSSLLSPVLPRPPV